jgi:predicted DNA-binding transcriptional regulator YafY
LRVLEMLQNRSTVTAADLADTLGVTERAARRYIAILREAGIPVISERGPYGGYQLGRGIRLPPLVFTATEALGLVMAVLETDSPAAGDDVVGAALDKFLRALPASVARQAIVMRQHAATVPDHRPRPDPVIAADLVEAVASKRRITITYRNESGRSWSGDVDPWAVVIRHGRWYLACYSHRAGAVRTFRVDRVLTVVQQDEICEPPIDIDPVALVEEQLGRGWKYPTRVRFHAPLDAVRPYVNPPMGSLEAVAAEAECDLVGSTRNPQMYASEWLAQIPIPFTVIEGPELADAVATLAARLTAAVEKSPAPRPSSHEPVEKPRQHRRSSAGQPSSAPDRVGDRGL